MRLNCRAKNNPLNSEAKKKTKAAMKCALMTGRSTSGRPVARLGASGTVGEMAVIFPLRIVATFVYGVGFGMKMGWDKSVLRILWASAVPRIATRDST